MKIVLIEEEERLCLAGLKKNAAIPCGCDLDCKHCKLDNESDSVFCLSIKKSINEIKDTLHFCFLDSVMYCGRGQEV